MHLSEWSLIFESPKLDINKVDIEEGYKGPMEAYNKSKLANVSAE